MAQVPRQVVLHRVPALALVLGQDPGQGRLQVLEQKQM